MKPYIILLLLVGIIFASSAQNPFMSLDDNDLIVNHPVIYTTIEEIPKLFLEPLGKTHDQIKDTVISYYIYYRPILNLYYILNYKIWGLNPVGFHISNMLVHLMSAILIYRAGILLFSNSLISLIAASFFAVHPASHEVLGRVALNENIYGFFIMLSFYLFLRERKYLSLFAFTLALLSKESAIIFPLALAVLAMPTRGFKKGLITAMPYILLGVIYFIVRALIVDLIMGIHTSMPAFTQIITMAVALSDYIRLLFVPYPVSPFYGVRWYASIFDLRVLSGFVILILFLFLILRVRKDRLMLSLSLTPIIMLATVLFSVNTIPCYSDYVYIADRQLYAPLMFFSLFVSAFVINLTSEDTRKYAIGLFSVIIVLFTLTTSYKTKTYKDDLTLSKKMVEGSPNSSYPHIQLGNVYLEMGRFDDAENEFMAALNPNPVYKDTTTNITINKKRSSLYSSLWEYQSQFTDAHFGLGLVYLERGDIEKATRKFKVAAILRPDSAKAHYNLGILYQKQGKFNDAIKEYKEALKVKPDYPEARNNLGILTK